jgi:hypothetical protein
MLKHPVSPGALDTVLTQAFGAGDGAYAWKREMLPDVFEALAAAGRAVMGGEVWGLQGFEIYGSIPARQGHTRIFAWSTPLKAPEMDWPGYVALSIRYARRAVRDLNAESEVLPAFRDRLVYHLQFRDEAEYRRITAGGRP